MMRTQPLAGKMPPENVADALCLMSAKDKDIPNRFPALQFRMDKLANTMVQMRPYMQDRQAHARELFERYKGYYPYYYYFGNLKATRKTNPQDHSSTAGVN